MAIVLKSESPAEKGPAARSVAGLAGFNLNDLADEGRVRLDQCRVQVRQMLEQANKDAEQIRKEAEQKGYDEGLKRAAVDADKKLAKQAEIRAKDGLQAITKAVGHLYSVHEKWMQQYAESLNRTALSAAERIVLRRLETEPELLVKWAKEALHSTRSSSSLTLAVHPETLAQLGRAFDELLASSDLPEQTHVEPDESVKLGEVVVRQIGGEISAGLQSQLQRLEEMLS
ncbi:MAG: FliH/SctL family protein [Rubripirellula sp.]